MADIPVTQRAYTLRLRGVENDDSWKDRLWRTHEAVNKGAKAFGDWLLTMRGGLSHELVDMKVKTKNSERDPTDEEKRDRRVLLALSWLSVESKHGAPEKFIVPCDIDAKGRCTWKTVDALKEILKLRGLDDNEISQWVNDCSASLSAAIRDDAVWVNRSKAFDEEKSNGSITEEDIWDFLKPFFSSPENYLKQTKQQGEQSDESEVTEEKEKDLVQKAGQWLSSRFGTGKGADFSEMKKVYDAIALWASTANPNQNGQNAIASLAEEALSIFGPKSNDLNGVLELISGPGYKSATRNQLKNINNIVSISQDDLDKLNKVARDDSLSCAQKSGNKGKRDYANKVLKDVETSCGFTYHQNNGPARHSEFAVMLDHAARRVSLVHTWIKRAETERKQFEEDAKKIYRIPQSSKEWLDAFCEERSENSGAIDGYRIRKRAVDGWKEIVKAWSKADCRTEEDRIAAARALRDDPEIDKFGDIQLFEALAVDDAKCVWHKDGDPNKEPDPNSLLDYVAATDAEAKKRRFKVPAYRHPDPLLHPVFCDFGNSRWDIEFDVHKYKKNSKKAQPLNIYGLNMGLFDGSDITKTCLQWSSKLLTSDLALKQPDTANNTVGVSRASRLGRAANGTTRDAAVNIAGLFEQKYWNGRLQAPRGQLEEISRVEEKSPDKATVMRSKIKWLITFSPRLQQQGPWMDYVKKFADDASAKPFVSSTGEYAVKHKDNDSRNGHAKLILSRLPGLRVLSVDLGHRYAAACAVWETLTNEQVEKACKEAGREAPSADALYLHLNSKGQNGKDQTTIYRRIGADTLPDGTHHPAPWARLDRQFLIKLQGEEKAARRASPAEIEAFCKFENELGRRALEDRTFRVDELMSDAVNTVRLALKRHANRARIAYYLITSEKIMPGGQPQKLDANGRIEILTDSLELWHGLFSGSQWTDEWAKEKWDEHIRPLLNGTDLPESLSEEENITSKEHKKWKEELRNKLKLVAEKLAKQNNMKLHVLWATRWQEDDVNWKKRLRWLRDWILPRGKSADSPAIRHVGGLSLTRIATIKSLYQVQKAFFQRFTPDGRQMDGNKPVTADEGFGQSILDALENMRDQRVKQLASRIVEAALGVGRTKIPKNGKDPKRPCERVDAPCHAVVIENLANYRPEETRTRRENRQLMTWSSSKVKKYLSEGCQLHGLHLREVQAGYTSRQDSRTGAPGIRCQDVPVNEFMKSPFWRKQVKQAEAKQSENKGDAHERFLCDLNAKWKDKSEAEWDKAGVVRIPLKGGEIFVSADPNSPAARGLQADLNAAANIGLKALLDPDWPGRWWYVPCEPKGYKPVADKVKGSAVFRNIIALKTNTNTPDSVTTNKKKGKKTKQVISKEVVNLWHDPCGSFDENGWQSTTEYWNKVQYRVIEILRKQMVIDSKL